MIVTLPWPHATLSPNARSRTWHKAARAKKAYRAECMWLAHSQGLRKIDAERVGVRIIFCPPNNLRRDDDNTIASFKSGRDGIAEVIGVDDGFWTVAYEFGPAEPGGAVRVEIIAA